MVRTLAFCVLLMGGSLLSLVPSAPAQSTPSAFCFDRDPGLDGQSPSEGGPCSVARPPDYGQGDSMRLHVPGRWVGEAYLSARCTSGCPAADPAATKIYWVVYRGGYVHFPADFIDPGPDDAGGNAVLDRAPRYNSTWQFDLHIAAPVRRMANVWAYDAWADKLGNHTVRPGATHKITASGFDAGGEVVYRWERRDPNSGRYITFHSETTKAQPNGLFIKTFQFAKSEAPKIAACGGQLADCYRIQISGAGKSPETINVQMGLAEIRRSEATTPRAEPGSVASVQRSQNVTGVIDLYYPSGNLFTGPKFLHDDAALMPRFGGQGLRVAVEKFYSINATSYLIDEVPLRFDPAVLAWTTRWTVPKDLPIDDAATYRLRIVDQRDVYGNRIAEDWLLNFTVSPATLRPSLIEPFSELRRTEVGTIRVAVLYHNGTPFTPADAPVGNTSPLRGCFLRVPEPTASPAPSANAEVTSCEAHAQSQAGFEWVYGQYYDGAWNFTKKYPRGYENLDSHRFVLGNSTRDRYGDANGDNANRVWSVIGPVFQVTPAQPEVKVTTVMRGEETDVLERGNRVFIQAEIRYHDGSPYNHYVRVNPNSSASSVLGGTLIRRGPAIGNATYGPIASEEPFNLSETDPSAGHWSAYLQLTDDDTFTPAGMWTWKFDVADNLTVPNRNASVFEREVVSSVIRVCPTFQPPSSIATGATIKFRFKLYYSECEVGREVPVGAIESKLVVRAYRYSQQNLSAWGEPVSNVLIPSFTREGTLDWGIDYTVPNHLYAGSYTFVVTGADTFGNKVVPGAKSRAWSTFTEVVRRSVLTEPQGTIERGDSATVVFDAREGDTSVDPNRPHPRIQLERFDTSTKECPTAEAEGGCWVRELADVRVADDTLSDHVGVFPVGVDTPVGLYRFSLQGRDREYHIITGLSANFSVSATAVSRALLALPPETIIKGEPFNFRVESLPGDQIRERVVFLNGRVIATPAPQITHERGALNVTWGVPFEAPTGNYTLRLSGRDVNGNVIVIVTPPIDALPASLEGRIVGQPPKTVQRGDSVRLQFGVGYPDGSFYAAPDEPRVFVVSAAGTQTPARVVREGLSFAAVWEPGPEAPLGEHYFEVQPQANGATGNLFPTLRSNPFRVVPGAVGRSPIDDMTPTLERLAAAGFSVPLVSDDRFVGFELVYYGPSLQTAIDTTTPLVEVTRTPLPHTIQADQGKYVARLATDHQTQTGTYRIHMTGEDAHGNLIEAESRTFVIMPTTISITYDPVPDSKAFGEGKTITLSFVAKYSQGTLMDESYGTPSAVVLWNGQPAKQRPDISYRDGHWFMTWTAPAILPVGTYEFMVGGTDVMNNRIAPAKSTPYLIQEGSLLESANKVIPGPSPILAALVAIAIAGLLLRKRRA